MYTEFEERVKQDIVEWYLDRYQKPVEVVGLPRAAQLYWDEYFKVYRKNRYIRQYSS